MKALVEKDILMKKQEKEMRKAPHFFMYIYQGNSRELERTQGNSRELIGSARRGNGRKKTQEKGQRGEISQMTGEKRKHRSALRALKNIIVGNTDFFNEYIRIVLIRYNL